jgi:DNA-binding CsgD family transcriptional regulator
MGPTLGLAHLCVGDVDAARALLDDALAATEATGNGYAAAVAGCVLAAIERGEGEYASAERRLHEALVTFFDLGCPQPAADVLEELAGIELDHGRPQPAAVLFGAASTIRSEGRVVRRVGRQDAYEADLARLLAEPDAEDLAGAWEQGARLTLADAVAYAERGRGERGRPDSGWESLTATEAKVAELVALGHTNPEVAETLIMGRATVKADVSSMLRKLGLHNRTQLARVDAHREQV